jgi:hypothetical protein
MGEPLSREEREQLRSIFHAWALNKGVETDPPVLHTLIKKGMLHQRAGAVRLTEAGLREVKQADATAASSRPQK